MIQNRTALGGYASHGITHLALAERDKISIQ